MKKQMWVVVVVILVVGVLGYMNKHAIKEMLMGGTAPAPSADNPMIKDMTEGASPSATTTSTIVKTMADSKKGNYLVGANGMTLYTYDKDTKGKASNCSGGCSQVWPAYTTAAAPSSMPTNVTLIKRTDGAWQYAYKGWPLYYYATDTKPSDITGDGVGGVWHIVKP